MAATPRTAARTRIDARIDARTAADSVANGAAGAGEGPEPPDAPRRVRGLDLRAAPDRAPDARFVAIAGNIGAGKSTLTSFLESRFGIRPFYEPNDANPYLTDFYADMARYAFHSQMYFLSAKFRAHLELAQLLDDHPNTVFVQDRTIYEDAEIFATVLHDSGVMSDRDYETYMRMYRAIRDSLPRPDLLIYLRCSTRTVRKRIRQRGRANEQDIDPRYLRGLHKAYEAWFERYDLGPTLVIETERLDYLSHLIDRLDLTRALERVLHPGAPT